MTYKQNKKKLTAYTLLNECIQQQSNKSDLTVTRQQRNGHTDTCSKNITLILGYDESGKNPF